MTPAKLASVVVVVLLLHVAINALPGDHPARSPRRSATCVRALALQLALLLQTAFVCASIVAAQGLLGLLAAEVAWCRAATSLLQFGDPARAPRSSSLWSAPLSRLAYACATASTP